MYESLCAWLTDDLRSYLVSTTYALILNRWAGGYSYVGIPYNMWRLRTWTFEPSIVLSGDKIRWRQTVVACKLHHFAGICFLPITWPMKARWDDERAVQRKDDERRCDNQPAWREDGRAVRQWATQKPAETRSETARGLCDSRQCNNQLSSSPPIAGCACLYHRRCRRWSRRATPKSSAMVEALK